MARVSVVINNRPYQIACDDGQETHLMRLAKVIDTRVNQMVAAVGQVGDAHLLVLASLVVADELSDMQAELETLRGRVGDQRSPRAQPAAASGRDVAAERESAETMTALAKRIEGIAERLEQA
jgi:cell division protein ZapA